MVPHSPGFPTIRLRVILSLLPILAACHVSAFAAPADLPIRSDAERSNAGWRIARGLDLPATRAGGPEETRRAGPLASRAYASDAMDDHWRAGFGLPVPDRGIEALLLHGGALIAGGRFTRIGGLEARGVAVWDGTDWSTLGEFPGESVVELAAYPGGLVALEAYGGVWRWDGAVWTQLPAFEWWASYCHDMAVMDDQIAVSVSDYVTGAWVSRVLLAAPDGWTTLGGDFDATVETVAWYRGELYAGGWFRSVGGIPALHVARWDGTAWQPVGEGLANPPSYGAVRDLAVYADELVAGGWFRDEADPSRPVDFARWDGMRWAGLGPNGPENPNLTRLKVVGAELYALGSFNPYTPSGPRRYGIARWDGAAWHTREDSLELFVNDIVVFRDELHAGGSLGRDGSRPASPLSRRRLGRWETPLTPTVGAQGLLGSTGPDVRAIAAIEAGIAVVGQFDFAGAPRRWVDCSSAALWDGIGWSSLGSGMGTESYPNDLALHGGALYAVGSFSAPSLYGSVARLEGGRWHLVGSQSFYNVYRIASVNGDLLVGGNVDGNRNGIARWDGTAWQDVDGGITSGNYVTAITAHEGRVVVAGSFDAMGAVPCRNIATWSAATGWEPLGEFPGGPITDLLSRDGVLYASGFGGYSGQSGIARWKGGRWEPLAGAGFVSTLGWFRGRLVASGDGLPGRVAILEADSTWHPLGSGIDGVATSFAEVGPSLFMGGTFSLAGGKPAYGFAEWREDTGIQTLSPRVAVAPNPSAATVYLRYDLGVSGRARVEIYDLSGALVTRPFDGDQAAGPQEVAWRPDPGRVRAGVYFARVVSAGVSRVVRVIRVD